MVELRGFLRGKILKMKRYYPKVTIREPTFIVLPKVKGAADVDIKYPLLEPFAYAHIKWDSKENTLFYTVEEPELAPAEKKKLDEIEKLLTEMIDVKLEAMSPQKSVEYLHNKVSTVLEESDIKVSKDEYVRIMYYILRNFIGLNEIEPLMHDPYIEDLGCSGLDNSIYVVHRIYGPMETNISYSDFDYLNDFVIKLSERCGRYISYAKPLLGGTLPDGSRVQASLAKDVTTKGPTFSVRKFRKNPFSPADMLNLKTASPQILAYLWYLVEHYASILVCGGVATGKTTFLNAITMFIPPEDKIVSIEDVREINLPHENWIPSTARVGFGVPEAGGARYGEVTLFDLLKESFRMKPDYTVVGEVRGNEAYVMFQGMASGNPSMGTIHAGSVQDVIKRLETPPIEISPSLIEALDIIIVMVNAKERGESARRVKEVMEIQSVDPTTGTPHTIKTFAWIPSTDEFKDNTANSQVLRRISFETGIPYPKILEEIKERTGVMEWMQRHNVTDYDEVCRLINLYYKDRKTIMEWVSKGLPPYKTKKTEDGIRKMWKSSTGLKVIE